MRTTNIKTKEYRVRGMRYSQSGRGKVWTRLFSLGIIFFTGVAHSQELQESPVPDAYAARALFTTGIVNREPVDQVVSLDAYQGDIYFFTDLRNLEGRSVTHRWEFEGQFMGQIDFAVGGPRWRVYSKKTLNPGVSGKWTVLVLDESGWPLHASIFMQGPAQEE
ncbi:MAG: DUF2914 domain-containing protein [Candidatus Thiodiazotropha sp. (ex Semelilucina semeliformis)]|nr:DUF2914 domain-containing protein [Candidatus Thiodiazotropha sp. (ex Myrtea spinifera)]MCU7809293.1 DUF2914 domain-containing protein [Candidatus Thiodiazotropha sp. (ex Semelilucina semeliformis)]MCU7830955.1 DUF2914 domain-containing protein [Candidatus Thiodiazotropha sp. (ex Myrtea sp. 'scaly one' KF741663)]